VAVTCWTIGVLGFDSRQGLRIFLFTTASRTTLGPTQPPIQWIPGALSLAVKRPGREADHSPPSRAEVKEWVELYLHSTNTLSWRGAQLKHRDNFTFTVTNFYLLLVWVWNLVSHIKRGTHWECSRTGCCEKYLDLRGRKWRKAGKDCIMRSFITCTLHQKLGWSNKVEMGEACSTHGRDVKYTIVVGKPEGNITLVRPSRRY
jgi:hypothetical protein